LTNAMCPYNCMGMNWKESATKDELAALAKHGKRKLHYKRLAAQEQADIMRIYERVKKRRQRAILDARGKV